MLCKDCLQGSNLLRRKRGAAFGGALIPDQFALLVDGDTPVARERGQHVFMP